MIRIAILDDNPANAADVKKLLSEYPKKINCNITEFSNPHEFLQSAEVQQYDIVFIDIMLGDKNGIDAGAEFAEKQPYSSIIFMSANAEYFKDVYKVPHIYFLTKELERERFFDAVTRAVANIRRESVTVETKNGTYKIVLRDVLCFESNLKHTRVCLADGSIAEYNVNLKEIEALLPEKNFVRIHQSFIVNMRYITRYDRKNVVLKEMKTVPISRTYSVKAREEITCWLGGGL